MEHDRFHTPDVGDGAERKYRLIAYYVQMLSTSMKNRWDGRAYIDSYDEAGNERFSGTTRIAPMSADYADDVLDPFDRDEFCDLDPACIDALKSRAELKCGATWRIGN